MMNFLGFLFFLSLRIREKEKKKQQVGGRREKRGMEKKAIAKKMKKPHLAGILFDNFFVTFAFGIF